MEGEKGEKIKLDIKNIALKAPKKSKNTNSDGLWSIFWISNIPKRERISDIKKEYLEVVENMTRE